MAAENKCPLCGKINPPSEWVCEECGAQLPFHGKQTKKESPTPQAKSGNNCGQSCAWGCGIFFVLFVLLPMSCSMLESSSTPTPTPAPYVAPTPSPTPYVRQYAPRVWVNTSTGVYHRPGGRWYGNTKSGQYMTEQEALQKGYRASRR